MKLFYIVLLIVEIISVIVLLLFSRKKYIDYIQPLSDKEYSIKGLLPVGLYILDKSNYGFKTSYDTTLHQKVVQVYGTRYAQYYLKIHWAGKIIYSFIGLAVSTFLGIAGDAGSGYLIVILVSTAGLFFLADKNLNDMAKKRKLEIQIDFPDFMNKLILLINAGMTVRQAFFKIVSENRKDTVLYSELDTVIYDIKEGKPEIQAYVDLSERCKVKEVTSFVGILNQNLKMGGARLVYELKQLGDECWDLRKRTAKQLGEEASAKLIFPMMLMFLAVLIIVMTPAIMALKSM